MQLENATTERYTMINYLQNQLDALTGKFDSYIENVEERSRPSSTNSKNSAKKITTDLIVPSEKGDVKS